MTTRVRAFAFVFLLVGAARADATKEDKVAAQALFDEARTLLAQQNYDAACAKFEASQRLDPAVGTLLNLGDCFERRGSLASAWWQYREAAALAARKGNDERRRHIATTKAAALEPKLAHLVIRAPSNVTITRDQTPVDAGLIGTAVPIDAGEHIIEARAEGKLPFRTTVTVANGAELKIDVPALEPEPAAQLGATPAKGAEHASSDGGGQRVAALVVGGVGIVALGVGSAFALDARSTWSGVNDKCPSGRCPDNATLAAQAPARDDASRSATIATVGFVAGGALVATSVVLFLTAPRRAEKSAVRLAPAIGPGAVGLNVGGPLP
jgi:hypothetical protein